MGAQQSRADSTPAPEGHAHKLARQLKRHSGVDKLFKSSHTPGANTSQTNSTKETEGGQTKERTPAQSDAGSVRKELAGNVQASTVTAALGGGTAVSAVAPVSLVVPSWLSDAQPN
jgi:hypothetical protein